MACKDMSGSLLDDKEASNDTTRTDDSETVAPHTGDNSNVDVNTRNSTVDPELDRYQDWQDSDGEDQWQDTDDEDQWQTTDDEAENTPEEESTRKLTPPPTLRNSLISGPSDLRTPFWPLPGGPLPAPTSTYSLPPRPSMRNTSPGRIGWYQTTIPLFFPHLAEPVLLPTTDGSAPHAFRIHHPTDDMYIEVSGGLGTDAREHPLYQQVVNMKNSRDYYEQTPAYRGDRKVTFQRSHMDGAHS
ncbi:hypothetical protein DFJ77DRAFT_517847 [Powellomyces hirtus]|nr:hypothetical protein DFJ77DRAFT_517847 [Powellomyces hirtus]